MKILILGMPYFASRLYSQLSEYDRVNQYVFLNTFYYKKDKIKYIFHLFNSDIVYIHGGSICCSGVINLALFLKKRVIIHWAGTDVLKAKEIIKKDLNVKTYMDKVKYLCVSKSLQEELLEIGIKADTLSIISLKINKNDTLILPKKIKVLAYIGNDRPIFYGIEKIINLAKKFPHIEFRIAGLKSYKNLPNNIKLLGWIENMNDEYQKCIAFIRVPEHDGAPFSVLEAMSYGRIVFYNYKVPYVRYVKNYKDLEQQFEEFVKDFENGRIQIDKDAINYVKEKHNKEVVLNNLIKVFKNEYKK